ncbi:MAG: RluA family pseudouridine synthase [Flavobacteriales bacterium]
MLDEKRILFEDNHLIAVLKFAGEIVQGDKTGDQPLSELVADFLKKKYEKPGDAFIGVIHRIDRPVSGVVLLAKTSKALSRMNELFRDKQVKKTYWALVEGAPLLKEGKIEGYLFRNEKLNKSFFSENPRQNALASSLSYRLVRQYDRYSLLEIHPHTGRHHQIRVMLAHIGNPIKGDVKYGARRANPDQSICLHARALQFIHPIKKENILIQALLPETKAWEFVEAN